MMLYNYPEYYFDLYADFPKSFQISGELRFGSTDFIHLFVEWEEEWNGVLMDYCKALKKNGVLWISWPGEGHGAITDLNADLIRAVLFSMGLTHLGQLDLDGDWKAIGFRFIKTKNEVQ